jgi:hypothetical protein
MAHRGMKTRASVTRTSPLSKILCWTNMCVQLRDFQLGMNKQYFGRLVCTAHLFICAIFMGSACGWCYDIQYDNSCREVPLPA